MVISAYERGSFEGNLLDLFEPGFSPAFFPEFIDNMAFPPDWFDRTSTCDRECTECGYCDKVLESVRKDCTVAEFQKDSRGANNENVLKSSQTNGGKSHETR